MSGEIISLASGNVPLTAGTDGALSQEVKMIVITVDKMVKRRTKGELIGFRMFAEFLHQNQGVIIVD